MSFRKNDHQQLRLNDRLNNLTERERRILEKSWAVSFSECIFPMIDESKFEVLFCTENKENNNGRPNTPVNVVLGSLFLQEMTHINDEELVESVILDPRFQVALRLTSFDEIPYSDRTPSRFRERLYKHELLTGEDLLKEEVERLGEEFTKFLNIHNNVKRMDSLMVLSSCKRMGRLELMYTCVSNLVKAIIGTGEEELLTPELMLYTEENRNSVCYRLDKEEVQQRLERTAADALQLLDICGDNYLEFEEYQLLKRMLDDQTKDGKLKPNKEILPTSLQNPSDPDATFRRKNKENYQGYAANVVETCGENGNIITQYEFDINLHSDVEFGATVIENHDKQEENLILIGDGAFASSENFEAAKDKNITLVTTNLTGQKPPKILIEFTIENDTITACPAGCTPTDAYYNEEKETYYAQFDRETCNNCPQKEQCPIKITKKTATVKIAKSTRERAEYTEKLSTEEYKQYGRCRNGVEGVPSVLRRFYGVDTMPVRGLVRAKMRFGFMIGAINAKRVVAIA